MRRHWCVWLSILAGACCVAVGAEGTGPTVRTGSGELQGVRTGGVEAFLGIPYALPPTGTRRWRPPEPAPSWRGRRAATRFGSNCYQAPPARFGPYTPEFLISPPVSEDCLYLNVWTPAAHGSARPVYVFIHGGGFASGSGSIPIYNGSHLAARGVLVVTINYRLGVFGFLALPALSDESADHVSGNYGLLDIIAALRWVHDNAAAFGGDPQRVTIAGQSAGAMAVNDLLVAPAARGLFARAIAESGLGLGPPMQTLSAAQAQGQQLLQQAGVESLAQLRALPPERLLALTNVAPPPSGLRSTGGPPPLRYAPVEDGVVLAGDPKDPSTQPQSDVPVLSGYNHEDIGVGGLPAVTPAQFEEHVREQYGAQAARFLALYPHATAEQATGSQSQLARDRLLASLVLWGQARERLAHEPIYGYLYDHAYPGPESARWGAFHTSEVPYVFGVLDAAGRTFTAQDRRIAAQLQDAWLGFIRTGQPGGAVAWPRLRPGSDLIMGLGDQTGPRPAVSSPQRFEVFKDFVRQGGQLSSIG